MNDHVQPEPNPSKSGTPTGMPASDTADLDLGNGKWRLRLASIKESPFRVVLVACAIYFVAMQVPIVVLCVVEGEPLGVTLLKIIGMSASQVCMAVIIGVVL